MTAVANALTSVLFVLVVAPGRLLVSDLVRIVIESAVAVALMVVLLTPDVSDSTNAIDGLALGALYFRWLAENTIDLRLRDVRGMRPLIRKADANRFAYNVAILVVYRFRMTRNPISPPQPSDSYLMAERDRRLGRAPRAWTSRDRLGRWFFSDRRMVSASMTSEFVRGLLLPVTLVRAARARRSRTPGE